MNQCLKMDGDVKIEIDYQRFEQYQAWDGIKGYLTSLMLSKDDVIDNYRHLW